MSTYATPADVKKYSECKELIAMEPKRIEAKLEMAEIFIDRYAGFWQKYDPTQTRLFPRIQDVNSAGTFIPEAIKFATIAQAEFMVINMPDSDHGVEEDEKPSKESMSPRARSFMANGLINRVGRVGLPWAQNPAYTNDGALKNPQFPQR